MQAFEKLHQIVEIWIYIIGDELNKEDQEKAEALLAVIEEKREWFGKLAWREAIVGWIAQK